MNEPIPLEILGADDQQMFHEAALKHIEHAAQIDRVASKMERLLNVPPPEPKDKGDE